MNELAEQILTAVIVGASVVIAICGIVRRIRRRGRSADGCDGGCGAGCPLADRCDKNKNASK